MQYKDTKLIQFLKTMSADELIDFEKYLDSPYFRKGRDPLPLLRALRGFHPFGDSALKEESVFSLIFPGQDFNDKKSKNAFRSLSSYLMKALEDFIFISLVRNDKVIRDRILLKEILDRNLTKYYEPYSEDAEENLAADESAFGLNNLDRYHFERINARYRSTVLEIEEYFAHTARSVENISTQFWIDLINAAKSILLGRDNAVLSEGVEFIDRMLESVDMEEILRIHEGTPNHVHISFHYLIYRHLKTLGKEDNIEKATEIFLGNKERMSHYDKVFYYSDLMNVYHMKLTGEGLPAKRKLFLLFKSCLEDRAYKISDADFMHPLFFRNAILCADYLKETDWAYEFIEKFGTELKPEHRENICLYSRALLDYTKGEYEESLKNITRINYDLVSFKTDVKILMLRIFYELELPDQADSTIDTLRHFVRSSDTLDSHYKTAFSNYLKFYRRLLKLRLENHADKSVQCKSLKKEIEQEKTLIQRIWLNEKLDLLGG